MAVKSESFVLLLNDRRPGHWRQVSALAHYLPAQSRELSFKLENPWRLLAPRSWPGGLWAHPQILAALPEARPDVLISCGRRSALLARWLQHHWRGQPKTIQILDCGLAPARFNWVIAPQHDGLRGLNVIPSLGSLNPIDEDWLSKAVRATTQKQDIRRPCFGVLLGGPSRHFDFTATWIQAVLAQIQVIATRLHGSVQVLGSARTPSWSGEEIQANEDRFPLLSLPWREDRPRVMEAQYAQAIISADCLVVTADSVNLISEACASGKPVLIAGSRRAKGKIGEFCRRMIQEAYARPLEDIDASSDPLVKTRCLRETKNIARQLIQSGLFN